MSDICGVCGNEFHSMKDKIPHAIEFGHSPDPSLYYRKVNLILHWAEQIIGGNA